VFHTALLTLAPVHMCPDPASTPGAKPPSLTKPPVCVCLRCPLPTYLGGVAALATPASPLGPAAFLHERDVDPFVATVAQQVENRAYQERALTALVYLLSPPGYSSLRSVEKERWGVTGDPGSRWGTTVRDTLNPRHVVRARPGAASPRFVVWTGRLRR
jgi:hypothetical protein